MSKTEKLTILDVNKTLVFNTPLEQKSTLCRTGTISEGSCFIHSILHSYSPKYKNLDITNRMKYIKKLRKSLSSTLTMDKWKMLGNGLVSKLSFQEKFLELLTSFYCSDNVEEDEMFELITKIVKLEYFEKIILPNIYKKYEKDTLRTQKDKIIKHSTIVLNNKLKTTNDLDEVHKKYLIKTFRKLIINILNLAEEQSFNTYIEKLYSSSFYIDEYFTEIISDYFNRDIFFIDGKTRMLYQNASKNNIKNRKSVILLWINDSHYEIVGRLNKEQNKFVREFQTNDPLILKFKMFLCNPEQISENHPELIEYLPLHYRNKSIHPKSPPHNLELDNDSD